MPTLYATHTNHNHNKSFVTRMKLIHEKIQSKLLKRRHTAEFCMFDSFLILISLRLKLIDESKESEETAGESNSGVLV